MKTKATAKKPMSPRARRLLIAGIAAFLALVLVLGTVLLLIPKEPALTYEGVSISRDMYSFWYSIYKTRYITAYKIRYGDDFRTAIGQGSTLESERCWDKESTVPGKTWGELMDEEIDRAIRQKLVAAVLYDKLGRSMSAAQKKAIDTYYEGVYSYIAEEDDEKLEALCEKYGTSKSAIKKCAALDLKAELYYNYLVLDSGAAMTPEEKNAYCRSAYTRFYVLAIYPEYRWVMKADGSSERVELNDLEKAARQERDAELSAYLPHLEKAGQMTDALFLEYVARYSDDVYHDVYSLGFFLSSFNRLPMLDDAVIEEAQKLKPGELGYAEGEDGKIYYIRAYDVGIAPYLDEATADFFLSSDSTANFYFAAATAVINERTAAELERVKTHEKNIEGISVSTLPRNTEFQFCSMN